MLSLAFAGVGGLWLWSLGFNSPLAVVELMALAGVAAETGVALLICLALRGVPIATQQSCSAWQVGPWSIIQDLMSCTIGHILSRLDPFSCGFWIVVPG